MVSMWCKYSQDSSKHVVSHLCNSVAFLCFIFSNKWREGVWSISGGFWKNTSELLMWIELPPFPYYQPLTPNCVACIVTVRRLSHNLSSGSINTKKKNNWRSTDPTPLQTPACYLPEVANVMLGVLTAQKDGLKLWWVIEIPPVEVEVGLRILGVFVSSRQNFKRTNQLQTQRLFQCTYID